MSPFDTRLQDNVQKETIIRNINVPPAIFFNTHQLSSASINCMQITPNIT